jgi:flagellar protein FlbT
LPLKFTLKPGEKVIVNGAVIGRGEEPGSFYLFNKVKFLRGREVMKEEQADTIEKKLYLIIQLIYLFPENAAENLAIFEQILGEVLRQRPDEREKLADVARLVQSEDYYRALKLTAKLF